MRPPLRLHDYRVVPGKRVVKLIFDISVPEDYAQADLLDLQDYMLERWTPELWQAAEDDIFTQLVQVDSGFITGPVVPLQPPRKFEQMTKYLSVSMPLPSRFRQASTSARSTISNGECV